MEKQVKVLKPESFADIETDGFVQVKYLRNGDVIYECEEFDRENTELTIISSVSETNSGWRFLVKNLKKEIHEIFIHKKYTHFPRFYHMPIFVEKVNNAYVYIIS